MNTSSRKTSRLTPEEIKEQNYEHYGKKIKAFRERAGLTAEKLAQELGISKGSVRNWECGLARPDLEYLFRMFRILDVEPNEFFGIGGLGTLLTVKEKSMLVVFRTLDDEAKEDAISVITALSNQSLRRRNKRILESVLSFNDEDIPASAGDVDGWPDPRSDGGKQILLRNDPVTARADEIYTVNGESMEPQFHDQEKVLVEHTAEIRNGDIGIFNVDKKGLVIKQKAYDRLHSLNEKYDDIFPYDGAYPVGRVIGKVDDYRISKKESAEYWDAVQSEKEFRN